MRIGEVIILQSHDSGSGLDHLPLSGASNNNHHKQAGKGSRIRFEKKKKEKYEKKEKEKDDLIHY